VITNCTPNHLDWHGTHQHYARSKQRLLTLQGEDDLAVLNLSDPEVGQWRGLVRGRLVGPFEDRLVPPLLVPGPHNRLNASLAAAAAQALGCSSQAVKEGLSTFAGLPHRLQFAAEIDGRRFYNDSKATTPEAAIAALNSFDAPVWLLAGGYPKGGDYAALAAAIARHAQGTVLFGAAGPMLLDLVLQWRPDCPVHLTQTLDEALAWVVPQARPGESILLSPACASFDQYGDFAERGRHFVKLVEEMACDA
jgi:UDP-N-acetylmuramoylalanine--D-glutamate ligase